MVFMIIPAWLLALIATSGSGILKAGLSQGSINQMNRYNDPSRQLQRLNAAGLPFAAFAAGQAGQQSNLPDTSGFDFMDNYATAKQMELIKDQLRGLAADADVKENLRDVSNEETKFMLEGEYQNGKWRTHAARSKEVDMRQKAAILGITRNNKAISDVEVRVVEALEKNRLDVAQAQLDRLLLDLDIGWQSLENERIRVAGRNEIIRRLEKGGLSLIEAIMIQVMNMTTGGGLHGLK